VPVARGAVGDAGHHAHREGLDRGAVHIGWSGDGVGRAGPAGVEGVLCWDEGRIHATAYVAEALGLRNGDPATIWRLRDKAQTRAVLAGSVAQPRSVPVKRLTEAEVAASQVGYPARRSAWSRTFASSLRDGGGAVGCGRRRW
jgi:hypothetical protein